MATTPKYFLDNKTKRDICGRFIKGSFAPKTAFKDGHIPWDKGIKRPDVSGKNHPMFGKKHTKEALDKISKTWYKKGQRPSPKTEFKNGQDCWYKERGLEHPLKGKRLPEEWRKKISVANQGIKLEEWNGFKTLPNIIERKKFGKEIKYKVLKRDNYTCQLCGIRGGVLQIDHIQPWKNYIKLRFNIENCRTLCMKCHYQITFGKPMPPTVRAWGHNFIQGGFKNI